MAVGNNPTDLAAMREFGRFCDVVLTHMSQFGSLLLVWVFVAKTWEGRNNGEETRAIIWYSKG